LLPPLFAARGNQRVRIRPTRTAEETEILNLTDVQRSELVLRKALTVDDDGDEVLVGLTFAESKFFLAFEEYPVEIHATGETVLYYQLKHNHLKACSAAIL
jgi:hypothetical protein